ncbi:MAG: hypothetical protein U1E22_08755 [Coriobacteriia bacterium]|nr:hypothetical protein [Coriobacteriia bacterium]
MAVSIDPDRSIKIVAARTRARRAIALFMLLPPVMLVSMLGFFTVAGEVWTWPAREVLAVLVFGVLLNPTVWSSLIFIVGFRLYWSGETLLYREGRFVVAKRLVWGRGFPHRIDVERLARIDVSVESYPRDAKEPGWPTSFRPRVVGKATSSRVMTIGEGLTLAEAATLAEALVDLIGPTARAV